MTKTVTDFSVIRNDSLNPTTHLIVLQPDEPLLPVYPGQFVNVEIPGNKEVFLRRPFSVFEADRHRNTLSLLVKVLGKGSATLTRVRVGEKLSLVYPLGRGFTMPLSGEKVLAAGGGSGVAPLLFLAAEAGLDPGSMNLLLGARTASDHFNMEKYAGWAALHYTTEDGSMGEKGLITDHSLFRDLNAFSKIYACGPLPMMKAIAALASALQISCEVSLENLMACGFGVCLCCIEPTVKGNLCVCTEGPVFNINDLKW